MASNIFRIYDSINLGYLETNALNNNNVDVQVHGSSSTSPIDTYLAFCEAINCDDKLCDRVCEVICDKVCNAVCDEWCEGVCESICDKICDEWGCELVRIA